LSSLFRSLRGAPSCLSLSYIATPEGVAATNIPVPLCFCYLVISNETFPWKVGPRPVLRFFFSAFGTHAPRFSACVPFVVLLFVMALPRLIFVSGEWVGLPPSSSSNLVTHSSGFNFLFCTSFSSSAVVGSFLVDCRCCMLMIFVR